MITIKINQNLNLNQKKALECMRKIAKARDELPYMRPLKTGEPGKKIFAEYIEGFICDALNLERAKEINQKDYDAIVPKTRKKIQIKDTSFSAPSFGKIIKFHYLITVKLNKKDFSINQIAVFPKEVIEKSIGNKRDFRFHKKKHSKFIVYENNRWLKKEIS
ncbi:MAG: hypothetical protein WC604_00790 [Candidatus Gracilibacteria bacterium]